MRFSEATTVTPVLIDRFHSWCIARGRSEHTAKAYRSDLNQFLLAVGEDSPTLEDYEELAMSWLNTTRKKVSPKTTGRRLTSLRAFGRWAGLTEPLKDYMAPVPAKGVPHPIPEGPAGVERMIRKARTNEEIALIALCGMVGCRIGEALSVRACDIDVQRMEITIRGKGDKSRVVPLSERAWHHIMPRYIERALDQKATLIALQDRTARSCVTRLGRAAGLQRRVASHDLRATFATAVYDHTQDLRVTQELLGHSNSATTEIYTGVSMNKMKGAVEF
jgi:site-specific recombinase XerD